MIYKGQISNSKIIGFLRKTHGYLHELGLEIRLIVFRRFNKLHIMSSEETIKYIKNHNCSVARLGDGEIRLMEYPSYNIGFQTNDAEMVKKLQGVLSAKDEKLLVCLPVYLIDRAGIKKKYKKVWEQQNRNWYISFYKKLKKCDAHMKIYGNASFTRPYMEAEDKDRSKDLFRQIKELWKDERLLIVEGEQTRLGVGNDLFDNVESIERILAPSTNAFSRYDEILQTILDLCKGHLVLLALGPTATILASDLLKHGIRAIDVGHIDLEYEWYLQGAAEKIAIKNKFVNEIPDGKNVGEETDKTYLSQIVKVVK